MTRLLDFAAAILTSIAIGIGGFTLLISSNGAYADDPMPALIVHDCNSEGCPENGCDGGNTAGYCEFGGCGGCGLISDDPPDGIYYCVCTAPTAD